MNHLRLIWGLGALIAGLSVSGCEDDDSGGSCGKVSPCGGNIQGSWTVVNSCVNSTALLGAAPPAVTALCPEAKITEAKLTTTGSMSFAAGLTYTLMASQTGTIKLNIPMSCLTGFSCAVINGLVQLELAQNPVPDIQSMTCAGAADCTCTIIPTPMTTNETGTYTTSGTLVTTTSSLGVVDTQDYCVQGSTLHLVTVDRTMNMGPMGQATITSDVVAQKR